MTQYIADEAHFKEVIARADFRAFSFPHRGISNRGGVGISRKVMPGVLAVLRKRLSFSTLRNQGCFKSSSPN